MGKSIVQKETPRNHAGFATARFAATRIFLEDHAFGGHGCSARGTHGTTKGSIKDSSWEYRSTGDRSIVKPATGYLNVIPSGYLTLCYGKSTKITRESWYSW
jgi:hypothetical protein